jgi:hypothetical protein
MSNSILNQEMVLFFLNISGVLDSPGIFMFLQGSNKYVILHIGVLELKQMTY